MLANANPDAWTRPPDGAGVKGPCVDRWVDMPVPPKVFGGHGVGGCVRRCPTFPPGLGSIIGAGRLSFRVRDGSGRFPVAVAAVTLFRCYWWWGGCGWIVVALWVSFRPVSASSLVALLRV